MKFILQKVIEEALVGRVLVRSTLGSKDQRAQRIESVRITEYEGSVILNLQTDLTPHIIVYQHEELTLC